MQKAIHCSAIVLLSLCLQVTICHSQKQSKEPNFRILEYGGVYDPPDGNAYYVVAKRWGFEYYCVAGCIVSKKLMDSVKQHNDSIRLLLIKEHGNDWKNKFQKEIKAEVERENKVIALIDTLDYIKKLDRALQEANSSLNYSMEPTTRTTKYEVSVTSWKAINGKNELIIFYKLQVDYHAKSVKLIYDYLRGE